MFKIFFLKCSKYFLSSSRSRSRSRKGPGETLKSNRPPPPHHHQTFWKIFGKFWKKYLENFGKNVWKILEKIFGKFWKKYVENFGKIFEPKVFRCSSTSRPYHVSESVRHSFLKYELLSTVFRLQATSSRLQSLLNRFDGLHT